MKTERLVISIGGISCTIITQNVSLLESLRSRYQWFESSGTSSYEILVLVIPHSEFILNEDDTNHPTSITVSAGDNYVIRQAFNPFVAVVNISSRRALVKMIDSEYSFDNFLRLFYSLALVKEGGLLLHGSSVSENGKGRIFFGPSGSGKTTIARLSQERIVLTDELTLIKPYNGKYYVYGTPFWGDFTPGWSNTRAELIGLYSLNKSRINSITPMDKVRAITALYRCVLFFGTETSLLKNILDTCSNLVDTIPVNKLNFVPNPSFWELLDVTRERGQKNYVR